jgi:hypothetical protein
MIILAALSTCDVDVESKLEIEACKIPLLMELL